MAENSANERASLSRRVAVEGVSTALLLAAVVGSGIMGERLAGGNVGLALLANTIATGAALVALILTFGSISGAHMNPAVTLAEAMRGGLGWRDVPGYLVAQFVGAAFGVGLADAMFGEPIYAISEKVRAGGPQLLSEVVATFGLLSVIFGVARSRPTAVPFAVGAYITAAYWFTASTSFANPAVTVARSLTNTFAGIRPADAPAFIVAQLVGAGAATAFFQWLLPAPQLVMAQPQIHEGRNGTTMADKVIFACVHNAGRSQMAAAFFNALADPTKAKALSAGTEPGERVHPEVLAAMKEVGIDLSSVKPQKLTRDLASGAKVLVTMGCGEACPVVPGARREDWPLEDPKGKPVERVREIRDDVRARVVKMLAESGLQAAGGRA